ncbi:MAG: hypothetical protein HC848_10810 [Limnobacter sp.]|nr:hypothetical protein [Limnobacter sp.]
MNFVVVPPTPFQFGHINNLGQANTATAFHNNESGIHTCSTFCAGAKRLALALSHFMRRSQGQQPEPEAMLQAVTAETARMAEHPIVHLLASTVEAMPYSQAVPGDMLAQRPQYLEAQLEQPYPQNIVLGLRDTDTGNEEAKPQPGNPSTPHQNAPPPVVHVLVIQPS